MVIGFESLLIAGASSKLLVGQGQDKSRTLAGGAAGGDSATMTLHNFAADCQPYPCPFILASAMQALEDLKDAVQVFLVETVSPILHYDLADIGLTINRSTPHVDHWRHSRFVKLERITD